MIWDLHRRLRQLEADSPPEDDFERAEREELEAKLAEFIAQDVDPTPEFMADAETRQAARAISFFLADDPEVQTFWTGSTTVSMSRTEKLTLKQD